MSYIVNQVTSKEDMRFIYIHEQMYDRSCGFSTISSLLDIYWNIDCSEDVIIERYIESTDINTSDVTISLADLSKILSDYHILNASFIMDFEQLQEALIKYIPVLVHYESPENHFALVLDADNNAVVVLDPLQGMIILSYKYFMDRWSGVVLLSDSKQVMKNVDEINSALNISNKKKQLFKKWLWGRK